MDIESIKTKFPVSLAEMLRGRERREGLDELEEMKSYGEENSRNLFTKLVKTDSHLVMRDAFLNLMFFA